jgi:uncharacterized membrane protein
MKRIGVIAILVLAFCGLADAAYLTEHVVSGTRVICNIQGLSDCNTIIASQYSRLFGVPLAEIGVFFYALIFVFAALELFVYHAFIRRVIQAVASVGVLASLYFVFLQAFVIRAFCIYCLTSAGITLLIVICASAIEPIRKKKPEKLVELAPPPARSLLMPPPTA